MKITFACRFNPDFEDSERQYDFTFEGYIQDLGDEWDLKAFKVTDGPEWLLSPRDIQAFEDLLFAEFCRTQGGLSAVQLKETA